MTCGICMKLWPTKKWKQILLASFLAVIVISPVLVAYIGLNLNKDVISGIDIVDPDGSKSALIVYQPGLSSFPRDVSYAFGNGLAASGWRVEITTASSQAPSDLSKYTLIVLGFPCYGASPRTAIIRYVDRLTNLQGINAVIVACAAGSPGGSVDTMKQKVQAAGGTFKESLSLFTIAPNEGYGTATDIARQAGTQI
jgi:flavorubredoxin